MKNTPLQNVETRIKNLISNLEGSPGTEDASYKRFIDNDILILNTVLKFISDEIPKERVVIQDAFDNGQANHDESCRDIEDGYYYYETEFKDWPLKEIEN